MAPAAIGTPFVDWPIRRVDEPIWLTRQVVEIIHLEQITEHGGRAGLRDETLLESALARPRQRLAYDEGSTIPQLAAAMCIGLAQNHPFMDGNKRVALLATYTFLALNGLELEANETDAADVIESLAGSLDEGGLAVWLGGHVR